MMFLIKTNQNFFRFYLGKPIGSGSEINCSDVRPGFKNKTECISFVRQDQVYTHMIDIISEYIKRQCPKRKQERVNNFTNK
jgi:hypothetical protein